jgi:hypothetical protein
LAGLLLGLLYTTLDVPFVPVGEFCLYLWAGVGAVFVAVCLFCAIFSNRLRPAVLSWSIILTAGILAIGWQALVSVGDELKIQIQFRSHKARYESILAELRRQPARERGHHLVDGIHCEVEPSPTLRVAFVLPGGILDNWNGFVYDPTGEVLGIKALKKDFSNWNDDRFRKIRMLFGGELCYCRHIEGDWYLCGFT